MADKEATVYIVDVGLSMGQKHHGRKQSDLDWAMEYVWDKITSTVSHAFKPVFARMLMDVGCIGAQDSDARSDRATHQWYVSLKYDFALDTYDCRYLQ